MPGNNTSDFFGFDESAAGFDPDNSTTLTA
jgi:hypothetical protein